MFDHTEQAFHLAAQPALCLRAVQHLPAWRERAAEAEKNRRLSRNTFAELFAGDWLDLLSPHAPSASDGHWPTLVECARIAARACASTGWMLALVGGHGCIARRLPSACKDGLYAEGPRQLFASASCSADSQLSFETNGVRVNGRWRFSSGIDDASWLMLNAPCLNHPNARNTPRFLLLVATHEVERFNSWDSCGMAATGSHDVLAQHVLVPHERVFALHEVFAQRVPAPGIDYIDSVYLVPYLSTSIIGPLLGCAEGAHAEYVAVIAGSPLAKDPRIAEQTAHSAAQLYSASLLYDSLLSRLHDNGIKNYTMDAHQLLQLKRDRAYLAQQCVQVVHRLVKWLSASSLVTANPLQRHWRDIQTMAAHRDVTWSDAMLIYGEAILCPASDTAKSA